MPKDSKTIILVPVDFTVYSRAALLYGSKMAELMNGTLLVLHVIHDPGEAPGFYAKRRNQKSLRKMEDVAAEKMEHFLSKARKKFPEHKKLKDAEAMLISGLPVTRIIEVAEKYRPEMVVMGNQGRTALSHLLLGSKAAQVVKICPVPVTIVKHEEKPGEDD